MVAMIGTGLKALRLVKEFDNVAAENAKPATSVVDVLSRLLAAGALTLGLSKTLMGGANCEVSLIEGRIRLLHSLLSLLRLPAHIQNPEEMRNYLARSAASYLSSQRCMDETKGKFDASAVDTLLEIAMRCAIHTRNIPIAPIVIVAVQNPPQMQDSEPDTISLLARKTIPRELEADPILGLNICPITQGPIRHPAQVPGYTDSDGNEHEGRIYEKEAIEVWVAANGTDPFTREPLTTDQITPCNELQALIDNRLTEISDAMLAAVEEQMAHAQPEAGQ